MFREVVLVLEPSPAYVAGESRLDPALHSPVQVQRLFPLVRFPAVVAHVAGSVHEMQD